MFRIVDDIAFAENSTNRRFRRKTWGFGGYHASFRSSRVCSSPTVCAYSGFEEHRYPRGDINDDHEAGPHDKLVGRLTQLEWRGPRGSKGRAAGVKVSVMEIAEQFLGFIRLSKPCTPMLTPS